MDTYVGHVRTPADAIKLFEACRLGLLPRVQRRLSEKERQSIKSGSVFVWDEREAGMRRWTDGKSWSASRVSGSFLTYREMEGKRGGGNFMPAPRRMNGKTPDSGRGSDEDADMDGEGPDGYRYKPDGLMKQSFSITTSQGQHLHLISYYSRPHANQSELMQPTQDPALKHIVPVKGMYPESTVHEQAQGPVTTRTPMQSSPYVPGLAHRQPYPYQVHQPYWPPSPVATPPHSYHLSMYSQHALPPPSAGHISPHHYVQHVPGQSPIYDRPPPQFQDPSLPQPQHSQHRGQPQMIMPSYAPNPSPRVAQAKLIAEQQAQQAQRLNQQMPIDPRITGGQQKQYHYGQAGINGHQQDQGHGHSQSQSYGHAAAQNGYAQPSPPQSNGNAQPSPPQSNGNPQGSPLIHANGYSASSPHQLNGHGQPSPTQNGGHAQSPASTHTPPQVHSQPQSQPPTPVSLTPNAPPLLKNDVSTGNSIPSISSLINHSDEPPKAKDTPRSNDGGSSRSESKSPKDSSRAADIPNDKLSGFGEDARAIRVLDSKMYL